MFLTKDFVWWILAGCIAGPILILLVIATFIALKKRIKLAKKYSKIKNQELNNEYAAAYGKDNILSVSMEMSRITVSVKDVDLVKPERLKELGASGVLLVGNQVKCSFKENVEGIYKSIKGSVVNE